MTEIWKELEGYSNYKFSNTGKVWSKYYKKILSVKPRKDGYIIASLRNNEGKRKYPLTHRLIALAFIPNPENKQTVNHKNHNRADNRVENLEWTTVTEQNIHLRKPSKEVTRLRGSRSVWRCSLDGEKLELYQTIRDAAKWLLDNKGVECGWKNISAVCLNKRKTSYGFKWIYDTSQENIFENEIWKDIPKEIVKGYTGYKISDQGRIKNPKGNILKGSIHSSGYKHINIGINKTTFKVHRLVAQVFIPNIYGKPFVNHRNHDKTDCKLYNLEWVTPSENQKLAVQFYSSKK